MTMDNPLAVVETAQNGQNTKWLRLFAHGTEPSFGNSDRTINHLEDNRETVAPVIDKTSFYIEEIKLTKAFAELAASAQAEGSNRKKAEPKSESMRVGPFFGLRSSAFSRTSGIRPSDFVMEAYFLPGGPPKIQVRGQRQSIRTTPN